MANNELGDFQTNPALAQRIVALVRRKTGEPATIIEPTCGQGNFVRASLEAFGSAIVHGLEVQETYIAELERRFQFCPRFVLHKANYFQFDWPDLVGRVHQPVWVIGNPPWVTNTLLTKLESTNLPTKSPQSHLTGIEAQTGKSNFDISESMIRDWFDWCSSCAGTLAVICKTSVARKVLHWWWKRAERLPHAEMYMIDAKQEFGATVAACVLVCSFDGQPAAKTCSVFADLDASAALRTFGYADGHLVANEPVYRRGRAMLGEAQPRWRSGIKHDAADVLELFVDRGQLKTKRGSLLDLEPDYVYPLVKGSDLARTPLRVQRAMIVPQKMIGENTEGLAHNSPKTWKYLSENIDAFEKRKSVIYRKGGAFSIFGVGDYTFRPWKIAIGALYKRLDFKLVGPVDGRPVMFDDTVYFLSFEAEEDARRTLERLETQSVAEFLDSMIFWDDMRPVKTEILNRINLAMAA